VAAVKSSAVSDIEYDHAKQQMHVVFKGGKKYTYHDVPAKVHSTVVSAASIGQAMAKHVLGKYRHT
jgi:hypothetical protein